MDQTNRSISARHPRMPGRLRNNRLIEEAQTATLRDRFERMLGAFLLLLLARHLITNNARLFRVPGR